MYSPEIDPAIEAAQNLERQHELENQKRHEMMRIIDNSMVPTYDQLTEANQWAENLRTTAEFDAEGNVLQEAGLYPVNEQILSKIESYYDEKKWLLSEGDIDIMQAIHYPGKLSLVESIAKKSPALADKLSEEFGRLTTMEKIDKVQEIKSDALALTRLNTAVRKGISDRGEQVPTGEHATDVRRQRSPSEEQRRKIDAASNRLIDSGLSGINTEIALSEINKAAAEGRKLNFTDGTVIGMTTKQRDKLLEYYGFKKRTEDEPINPRTLSPEVTIGEHYRRLLNGSQRRPKVAARHRLEAKAKLAQRKLDQDKELPEGHALRLSGVERALLERRIAKSEKKIGKGSFFNREKYGPGVTNEVARRNQSIYTTENVKSALLRLRTERESIDSLRSTIKSGGGAAPSRALEEKILNAVHRETLTTETTPLISTLELSDEKFAEILTAISDTYDDMLQEKTSMLKPGERLKDYEIDAVYINAQLAVAREIAEAYFEAEGLDTHTSNYDAYVRGLLHTFHSYTPAVAANKLEITEQLTAPESSRFKTDLSHDELRDIKRYVSFRLDEAMQFYTDEKREKTGDPDAELTDEERATYARETVNDALEKQLHAHYDIDENDANAVNQGIEQLRQDIDTVTEIDRAEHEKTYREFYDRIEQIVAQDVVADTSDNAKGKKYAIARTKRWSEAIDMLPESQREEALNYFRQFKQSDYETRAARRKS